MTIKTTTNMRDRALLDATLHYADKTFQFLVGVSREQLDYLGTLDEQDVKLLASRREATLCPSLRGAA